MTSLLPSPELTFVDQNGTPYAGGTIDTYTLNTSTPATTWQDAGGTIANTNPIVLNASGSCVCYGSGDYRFVLRDAAGNTIFDQNTSSTLSEDSISPVMLPVTSAATLATARTRMGIDAAIAAACAAISLMPGPAGGTGPMGPQGVPGPAGTPAGGSTTLSTTNPGYWMDNTTGFIINFGHGSTDSGGGVTVSYAKPFLSQVIALVGGTSGNASVGAWWINLTATNLSSFSAISSSPLVGGSWRGGPMLFHWLAVGW